MGHVLVLQDSWSFHIKLHNLFSLLEDYEYGSPSIKVEQIGLQIGYTQSN